MAMTPRSVTTAALLVSFITVASPGPLLAAEPSVTATPGPAATSAPVVSDVAASSLRLVLPATLSDPLAGRQLGSLRDRLAPDTSASYAQYRGSRRRGRGWHNGAAVTAVVVGAAASITGGALLVYANRPECGANPTAGGCSYGTKVVGGAVLAGGVVSMAAGALMWRR